MNVHLSSPWNEILNKCAMELSHASLNLSGIQGDLAEYTLHVSHEQITRIQKLDEINQLIDVISELLVKCTQDDCHFDAIKPQNLRDRILGIETSDNSEDMLLF